MFIQVLVFSGMGFKVNVDEICYVLDILVQKEAIVAERSIVGLLCFMQKDAEMGPSLYGGWKNVQGKWWLIWIIKEGLGAI